MRQRYKEKTQQLADVKTFASRKRASKRWKLNVHSYRGSALPTLWFHQPPGGRGVSGLEPGVNQSRLLALENEVKKPVKKVRRYVGNWTP